MLGSALLGYAGLFSAMALRSTPLALLSAVVAVLALYRAGSFIHELTHIKKNAVKGFRFAWNCIVGVPLLVPSFLYEGVHNQHHAKTYYGTANDPEYLPLALMKPWTLPVFLIAAALAPIGMLIRFGILAPTFARLSKAQDAGGAALLGPSDQSVLPPPCSGRRVRPRLALAGDGVQRLGDHADRANRDGHRAAARLPHLHRRRRRCDVPQSGPHSRRAPLGE